MSSVVRRTFAKEAELTGSGVFTGKEAYLRLIPTDEAHGIFFDVGGTSIPLTIENLHETPNRSTLASGEATIEVVEHLMACLHIAGITDILIECPNGEIPLLDGSALPLWNAIDSAGSVEINGSIEPITIEEPVYVEGDEAVLIALPSPCLKISYFLAYDDPRIGCEHTSLIIDRDTFGREIAPARSFIESERVEEFVRKGFVKSTDASQALVVYPDGVHGEFRVENEFAKHKMLDLIGDLYLAGRPVRGHFIGLRSGHGLNHRMIKKLVGFQSR